MSSHSHQSIRESILKRIHSGEWALGALIPGETDLAEEYGCARTTVNRALQTLADQGLLVRKRKGGTRVCKIPVRHAKFEIPIIREQVEATDASYSHALRVFERRSPPLDIIERLKIGADDQAYYMETLHLSDNTPFAFEERWINVRTVPEILDAPLDEISANEWLVQTVPFSNGDVIFAAISASPHVARSLNLPHGTALFTVDRTTWSGPDFITTMKLYYTEGYQLYSRL